jgi:5-methylcytosine-specific restriction protein A
MTDKRPSSTKLRREVFDANRKTDETGRVYMECHICHGRIWPGAERWDAEHVIPHANGGKEVLPAHEKCHAVKTRNDVSEIAKGKRVSERHFGIKQAGGAMPGSRRSKWKKKMNGEVVER